jgi:hypothetical protein
MNLGSRVWCLEVVRALERGDGVVELTGGRRGRAASRCAGASRGICSSTCSSSRRALSNWPFKRSSFARLAQLLDVRRRRASHRTAITTPPPITAVPGFATVVPAAYRDLDGVFAERAPGSRRVTPSRSAVTTSPLREPSA